MEPVQAPSDLPPIRMGKVLFIPASAAVDSEGQPFGGTVLVPLVCRHEDQLKGGKACLVARGAKVALDDGSEGEVGRPVQLNCGPVGGRIQAFPLKGVAGRVKFAVYPTDALAAVRSLDPRKVRQQVFCKGWCTFGRTGHRRVKIERSQRRRLAAAVAVAGHRDRGVKLEVVQHVELDLNDDGTPDQLWSVIVMSDDPQRYAFDFSALFLVDGGGPGTPVLLYRKDTDAVVVRGLLDFEGRGNPLLWLLRSPAEESGPSHVILSVRGGQPSITAQFRCNPMVEE